MNYYFSRFFYKGRHLTITKKSVKYHQLRLNIKINLRLVNSPAQTAILEKLSLKIQPKKHYKTNK